LVASAGHAQVQEWNRIAAEAEKRIDLRESQSAFRI
jgi:hypothetical protein